GEQLGVAAVAEHVQGLGVVVVRVLPVPETVGPGLVDRDGPLAKLEPLLAQLGLVFAGTEEARDRRRRQWRPLAAVAGTAVGQAVNPAAVRRRTILEVVVGAVDDLFRNGDAGVAGGAQGLDLCDRHRPLVKAAAVGTG